MSVLGTQALKQLIESDINMAVYQISDGVRPPFQIGCQNFNGYSGNSPVQIGSVVDQTNNMVGTFICVVGSSFMIRYYQQTYMFYPWQGYWVDDQGRSGQCEMVRV
ncbi:MAG: hypothetical protein WCH39_18875 [Schlesneria sp.]